MPIIILSALSATRATMVHGLEIGADDYLAKPCLSRFCGAFQALRRLLDMQRRRTLRLDQVPGGGQRRHRRHHFCRRKRHDPVGQSLCAKIFGYSAGEMVGQNLRMLMPPPTGRHMTATSSRYLEAAKRVVGQIRELTGIRRNGAIFSAGNWGVGYPLPNRRMFIGVVRDVSRRVAFSASWPGCGAPAALSRRIRARAGTRHGDHGASGA